MAAEVHASRSPSDSKRWMTCPGSLQFEKQLKADKKIPESEPGNKYAAEGTVAHELGELSLKNNTHPQSFLGLTKSADGFRFKVNDEMVEAVEVYVDYVNGINAFDEYECHYEVRCSLEYLGITGLDGGTTDCLLVDRVNHIVYVIDYKHGKGVFVEAEWNDQLLQYALGAIHRIDPKEEYDWEVNIVIVQPRYYHPNGKVHEWQIDSEQLYQWRDERLIPKALATHEPDAPLVASVEGCRWCACEGNCPAKLEQAQELAMVDFAETQVMPSVNSLTPEQKILVADNGDALIDFVNEVRKTIRLEIDRGSTDYQGYYKTVEKPANRRLTADALDEFSPLFDFVEEDEISTEETKWLPMGAIERVLKSKVRDKEMTKEQMQTVMDEITFRPDGHVVLVPDTDSRAPAKPSAISDFEGLED